MSVEENEFELIVKLKYLNDFSIDNIEIETIPHYCLLLYGKIFGSELYKEWEFSLNITANQYLKFAKPFKNNLIYFISIDKKNNFLSLDLKSENKSYSTKIIDV